MYRTNDLFQLILSFVSIIFVVYVIILFLPIILLVVGFYMFFIWIRLLLMKKYSKSDFSKSQENMGNHKVIDAEYEILDEK